MKIFTPSCFARAATAAGSLEPALLAPSDNRTITRVGALEFASRLSASPRPSPIAVERPDESDLHFIERLADGFDVEAQRRGGEGVFREDDEADAVAGAASDQFARRRASAPRVGSPPRRRAESRSSSCCRTNPTPA